MSALPTLVQPSLPDPAFAAARGGFTWWYCDQVDAEGTGFVAIVALGLPFLPGYASAARRGAAPAARMRPAICFAAFERGAPFFWGLHETDPGEVTWLPGRAALGSSRVEVGLDGGRARYQARIGGALPGCDWSAEIEIEGVARRATPGEPERAEHEWTVLAAGVPGRFSLRAGERRLSGEGLAYLDRNAGAGPLESLGVADWTWGRLSGPAGTDIWYDAAGTDGIRESLVLAVDREGASELTRGGARPSGRRFGRWGLAWPARVQLGAAGAIDLPRALDDSPFYARFLLQDPASGRCGFGEACAPGRIDQAWFRPLLQMTVCNDHRPAANSAWLPLFGGPVAGRWGRLLGRSA